MHEATLAQGIIDVAVKALTGKDAKITKITVVVGVLTHVQDESLEFWFTELGRGTPAEGAALEVRRLPAKLVCTKCRTSVDFDGAGPVEIHCAKCGGPRVLEGGDALYVDSLEVE
jgi:hydrogenase nickel incorporation protein HypA/HybF